MGTVSFRAVGRGRVNALHLILWTGFLLRAAIAVWNGFWGPSFGAEGDAIDFHHSAVAYARDPVFRVFSMGLLYPYFLGWVYRLTAESLFIGSLLSVGAWTASAFVLVRALRLLSVGDGRRRAALAIYALLPTSALLTGVTLREPFQMLFANIVVYEVLEIYLRPKWWSWPVLAAGIAGMGVLHAALLAFGVGAAAAAVLLTAVRRIRSGQAAPWPVILLLAAAVLFAGLTLFRTITYQLDDGLVATVRNQQAGAYTGARSEYRDHPPALNSEGDLAAFVPAALFRYLMEPMPWRISAPADAELFLENLLRLWLLFRALRGLWLAPAPRRWAIAFLVGSYLLLEAAWALGTINWGTAARHHLPSLGLLLLAAFASGPLPLPRLGPLTRFLPARRVATA